MRTGRKKASAIASGRRVVLLLGLLLLGGCWACSGKAPPSPVPVGSIIVSPSLLDYFDRWHGEADYERVVALYGRRRGMVVYVEGFDATESVYADSVRVRFKMPPRTPRVVGTLHTHPLRRTPCTPSDQDVRTMYELRHLVSLVACGEGRFAAVLRGDPRYHRISRRAP